MLLESLISFFLRQPREKQYDVGFLKKGSFKGKVCKQSSVTVNQERTISKVKSILCPESFAKATSFQFSYEIY